MNLCSSLLCLAFLLLSSTLGARVVVKQDRKLLLTDDDVIVGSACVDPSIRHSCSFQYAVLVARGITSLFDAAQEINVAHLGVGSGSVHGILKANGATIGAASVGVDLDASVVSLARQEFEWDLPTVIRSADAFVKQANPEFDVVVHDIYSGGDSASFDDVETFERILSHVLTPEPSSTLVVNFVAMLNSETVNIVYSRVKLAGFNEIRCFRDAPLSYRPSVAANVACFARRDEGSLTNLFVQPGVVVDSGDEEEKSAGSDADEECRDPDADDGRKRAEEVSQRTLADLTLQERAAIGQDHLVSMALSWEVTSNVTLLDENGAKENFPQREVDDVVSSMRELVSGILNGETE